MLAKDTDKVVYNTLPSTVVDGNKYVPSTLNLVEALLSVLTTHTQFVVVTWQLFCLSITDIYLWLIERGFIEQINLCAN